MDKIMGGFNEEKFLSTFPDLKKEHPDIIFPKADLGPVLRVKLPKQEPVDPA